MTFFEVYLMVANTVIPVGIWITLLWLWKCRRDDNEAKRLTFLGWGHDDPDIGEDFSSESRGICGVCEGLVHESDDVCPGPTYYPVPPKKTEGYVPEVDKEIRNSG